MTQLNWRTEPSKAYPGKRDVYAIGDDGKEYKAGAVSNDRELRSLTKHFTRGYKRTHSTTDPTHPWFKK